MDDDLVADFWAGYHRTYVERDARMLGEVADWQEFGRFYGLLCSLTAQEINFSQLGREIGMTPQTARRWLSILEATFQWFSLPAFSGNAVKRVASRPKGYIAENRPGLLPRQDFQPQVAGQLPALRRPVRERHVQEIRKQASTLAVRPALFHWRTAGGAEVDLILERDGLLHPFEFKLTTRPDKHDASGLRAFKVTHSRAVDRTRRAGLRRGPAALGDGRGAGHPVESAVKGRGGAGTFVGSGAHPARKQ